MTQQRHHSPAPGPQPLPKVATGILGLDQILTGGLPEGRTSLIRGGSGCGKSLLAMEFLYHAARDGRPGVYISFEEPVDSVRASARTLDWDITELEAAGKVVLMDVRLEPEAILTGEISLQALRSVIAGVADQIGAGIICLDGIDVFLRIFEDSRRERDELLALQTWFREQAFTVVLTAKGDAGETEANITTYLDYMADCVINLSQRALDQVVTRRIRILKYRGSDFGSNEYPFVLNGGGVRIVPITLSRLSHSKEASIASSGNPKLDRILGGGYWRGSSVLISGAAGTGKTTLACTFAHAACSRGEKVLYIDFEQDQRSLLRNMTSPGIDLNAFLEQGTLRHYSCLPESSGAEVHLSLAYDNIIELQPTLLVVDAISASMRMGSKQAAYEYVMRLVIYCKEMGITLLLVNQSEGFMQYGGLSNINVSSLTDTVIMLNHREAGAEVYKTILVLKSRGSRNSNHYFQYIITDHGIDLAVLVESADGQLKPALPCKKIDLDIFKTSDSGGGGTDD